tara:strand:- start:174 stop:596 length:423 start_codon:yes stop_codon:yes gene_type:complete
MNENYMVITPNGETITIEEYMETDDYDNRLKQQIDDFMTDKKEKELLELFKKNGDNDMNKIVVEENIYNIQTKKTIRELELWEEEGGSIIRRRLYILGDTDRRNNYIDRFSTMGDKNLYNYFVNEEMKGFKSPNVIEKNF